MTQIEHVFIIASEQMFREDQVRKMRRHHYRIVKPFRFFIFILISVMITVFAGYTIVNSRAEAAVADSYAQVVIQENDNLWDLASMYNPDRTDIRDIVYEIYDINGIDANNIQPGQVIFVPVYN